MEIFECYTKAIVFRQEKKAYKSLKKQQKLKSEDCHKFGQVVEFEKILPELYFWKNLGRLEKICH